MSGFFKSYTLTISLSSTNIFSCIAFNTPFVISSQVLGVCAYPKCLFDKKL